MSEKKDLSVEKIYQKKTLLEQILLRPDSYVGSIETNDQYMWVFDTNTKKIMYKKVKFVPGLYKIFDEILVNAADNYQRDNSMSFIKVEINPETNMISVTNNGKGIPCKIHKEHNVYVAGLIFGELLTSSNYNDEDKKVTGGRNGYGAKLANIFSTQFIIEAADGKEKKVFKQRFKNNMKEHDEPSVEPYKGPDFTKITFFPDLKRFGMSKLDDDILSLFYKRIYDMAGLTPVTVFLNSEKLLVKDFKSYIQLYVEETELTPFFYHSSKRWEVLLTFSDGEFKQVSFVNSICTVKGGTHVSHVADQVVEKIITKLNKQHKGWDIKPHQVKQHMWLFVNALIENPAFDSQTKETLTLKPTSFGSTCALSEEFIKNVLKSKMIDMITAVELAREQSKLVRDLGGKKVTRILNIEKLEDANNAGSKGSEKCLLILTEGDSAKGLAMNGIEIVGRDNYGVFPLRGKLLNVQDVPPSKLMDNEEIQNVMKIIGLKIGEKYENIKQLRYGGILIMTDQDVDGSHIKGLIINFISYFWPTLIQLNGFIKEFITPLIKATKPKGKDDMQFFNIGDYEKWALSVDTKQYKIKYYKGLGTSTPQEAKEYFRNIQKHRIEFKYEDNEDLEAINLAFGKKNQEGRKVWLSNYNKDVNIDLKVNTLRYKDFIYKELIHFSIYDNDRSIPCICDGLKPGQRKILFCAFKKKLFQEIKVAQFSGYVSEHSAYHHGEQSLAQTIVGLAQNFVGSNNINLFEPKGQFGTRSSGGKDAASARYIYTHLSKLTRSIFREEDDKLMNYLIEEGQSIEPEWYLPVIPMALVNGAEGIGTGWSTDIPCHNPLDLVQVIRDKLNNIEPQPIHPWYRNYIGSIVPQDRNYIVMGKYNIKEDSILEILELPIQKWTSEYKQMLIKLIKEEDSPLLDIRENHHGNRVHFVLILDETKSKDILAGSDKIVSTFKLAGKINSTNYVLFDSNHKLKKYNSAMDIINEFYTLRLHYYMLRKNMIIADSSRELEKLKNKVRFITEIITDHLVIKKKSKKDVLTLLYQGGYTPYSKFITLEERKRQVLLTEENKASENAEGENPPANEEQKEEQKEEPLGSLPVKSDDYDYLCNMNMWSLTKEKIEDLKNKMNKIESEIATLKEKSPEDLWRKDLDDFVQAYQLSEKKEHDIENKEISKVKPINYNFDVEKLKKAKIKLENEGKKEKEKDKGKKKGKGGKEGKDKKIKESKSKEEKKKRGRSKEEESPLDDNATKAERSVSTTAKKSKAKKKAPKDQTSSASVDSSESWSKDSKKEEKKKRQRKKKKDESADNSSMKDDTEDKKEEEKKTKKTVGKIEDDPKVKPKKTKPAIPDADQQDLNGFFGKKGDQPKKAEEPKAMKKPITFESSKLSGKKFMTITDD